MNNEVNAQSDGHLYIVSPRGYSAYEIAVQNGFEGTEEEWLASLKGDTGETGAQGPQGKSAYQVAVDNGFEGTEEDFVNSYLNADNYYNKDEIDERVKDVSHFFNTVAAMKAETNLKVGQYVVTLGYRSVNDGGGAHYYIKTSAANDATNGSVITLNNGLVAVLSEKSINAKMFGAKGDNSTDDTTSLKNCLDYCIRNKKDMHLSAGKYIVKDTLVLQLYSTNIIGEDPNNSVLVANADVPLISVKYSYLEIKNIGFSIKSTYSNSFILFGGSTNIFSVHIKNCNFNGNNDYAATAIDIQPTNAVNIQNSIIEECMFYKMKRAIYINSSNGYFNGNIICNNWITGCEYGLYFDPSSSYGTSNLVINNLKGQYSSAISKSLIENLAGSNNSVTDCLLWDGGKTLTISPYGKYTFVRNIGDLGLTKFEDFGYRTFIEGGDIRSQGGQYYEYNDNFYGKELSNIWKVDKSSSANVETTTSGPSSGLARPALKISTGATINNYAKVTLENFGLLDTGRWTINFDLNIGSLTNVKMYVGGYTETHTLYGNLITYDTSVDNKLRGISTHGGTIDYSIDLLDTVTSSTYMHCQITKDKNNDVYFWVNNEYVGKITPRNYNENPYIYLQTLDDEDKFIRIANLKIKHYIF